MNIELKYYNKNLYAGGAAKAELEKEMAGKKT